MIELAGYLLDLGTIAALLALALSVYMDGLGYTPFHLVSLAGVAAYTYAFLTTTGGYAPAVAALASLLASVAVGGVSAEFLRRLRGDGLTLATFGLGIGCFEIFRYLPQTGGVFGIKSIPELTGSAGPDASLLSVMLVLAFAAFLIVRWRVSRAGLSTIALRQDEWGAVSLGISLRTHQRIAGCLAGAIAGLAGLVLVSTAHFVEPRDFEPSAILLPIAAVVAANGRTPYLVVVISFGIVIATEIARMADASAVAAGPLSDILLSCAVGFLIVVSSLRKASQQHEA
jgi:ABC-type branched-subunit amino acid transport system permease subunit